MESPDRNIRNWCLLGFSVIVVLGFLLHDLYHWTSELRIIGLLVPVNESVWEHLKLGYWALLIYSAVEYKYLGYRIPTFFLTKTMGFMIMSFTILGIFYTYTLFAGHSILWIDILSYITGALFCQFFTFFMYRSGLKRSMKGISLTLFIGFGIAFALFTLYPPHKGIFKDANNDTYGINKEE